MFDGASEAEIKDMLKLAYPDDLKERKGLTDTRTQAYLYRRPHRRAVRAPDHHWLHALPEAAPLGR